MDTLICAVFSNAVIALFLGILAWGAGRIFRNAALSHALWLLVLVKLVTPPMVSLPVSMSAIPIVPETASDPATGVHGLTGPDSSSESVITILAAQGMDGSDALLILWGLGSAAFFLLLGIRVHRFRKLLKYEYPADAELRNIARRISLEIGLRSCPKVTCVPGRLSPLVWGTIGRPRVIIPGQLFERLSRQGREALLTHEIAHIRRRDHWLRWMVVVATGLFWWHPIVWLAAERIREAQDLCCDALVIDLTAGGTAGYAATLLDVVDFLAGMAGPHPALGVGFGRAESLRRRLTMIMKGNSRTRISSRGRCMILAIAVMVLPLAFGQPPQEPKPPVTSQEKAGKISREIKQQILESLRAIDVAEIVKEALQAVRAVSAVEIDRKIEKALSEIDVEAIRGTITLSDETLKDVKIDLAGLENVLADIRIELEGVEVELKQIEIDIKKEVEAALKDLKEIKREAKPGAKVPPPAPR